MLSSAWNNGTKLPQTAESLGNRKKTSSDKFRKAASIFVIKPPQREITGKKGLQELGNTSMSCPCVWDQKFYHQLMWSFDFPLYFYILYYINKYSGIKSSSYYWNNRCFVKWTVLTCWMTVSFYLTIFYLEILKYAYSLYILNGHHLLVIWI